MSGRVGESSPSKELLDEAATEGDTDLEEATRAGRAASRHRCQAAPRSVAFSAVILCAALLAIALVRRPQMVGVAPVIRGISLTTGVGDSIVASGTGCTNWHSASLDRFASSVDECVQSCRETRGCVAANYQANECPTKPHESKNPGACYLMNEECIQGPNECWAVYTLPTESRMPSFFQNVTRQAGCSNIGTIGRGQVKKFSRFECQASCDEDPACQGFIHQAKGCVGTSQSFSLDEGPHDPHTCELLNGECVEDKSSTYACWDIYHKDSKQGTALNDLYHFTEASAEGATTIHVTDEECFRVGDSLQLFHEASDANHRYDLVSLNPMTVSPPLTMDYAVGTGVLRINHPHNPKWCGDWPTD